MDFAHEQQQALRILESVEQGVHGPADTWNLMEDADPTLVYFIVTWLREHYPASHPASEAVLGRLGQLCAQYPGVTRMVQEGQHDSVVEWFEDAYSYRDLDARRFVALIVDKLES